MFLTKSENQTLKNGKSANHEKHHNQKTEFFFFAAKTANPKNPKPPRWDYHSYDYLKNILCHHEDFYKRSPLQSSRRFNTWYISERVLVFPLKDGKNVLISLFLFHTLAKSHWENFWASIQKMSDLFFFKHLYFYCSRQIALKGLDLRRKWPQRLAKLQFSAKLACKTKLSGFHILKF